MIGRFGIRAWASIALASATISSAAPPTSPTIVRIGDGTARTERLLPGTYRYLRYTVKDGHRSALDIWNRTVAFETHDGVRMLHLTQRWDEAKPSSSGAVALDQDSWFEAATFRPVTHVRRAMLADGSVRVAGYRFGADRATGMAELAGNTRGDFSLGYAEVPFNFEYDMELLQTLPLAAGYVASLPFYDAGIDPKADRYIFRVAGSATIRGWNGKLVDCWVVTADYNTGEIKSRFWFAKGSQLLVREEARQQDGATLIKTLLPPEPSD